MNLVLDQDLVAEVSARYDVFSIFKLGKKGNTTISLLDAEDDFWELFTWNKISSASRDLSTMKISSRWDKSLSR